MLGSDELDLARIYIESMERLQREKEAGAQKPQSRLSIDDLLFKEEATAHRTDTAAQPRLVPSGENQKRPGRCPPST